MMCGFRRCAFPPCAALAALVWMCLAANVPAAEMTMADLLELIRQNESLYANLDVTLEETFVLLHDEWSGTVDPEQPHTSSMYITKESALTTRHVSQGDLYRTERSGWELWVDHTERVEQTEVAAYDGQVTRSLAGQVGNIKGIGNIAKGRQLFGRPIFPHMLVLRMSGRYIPLSVLLGGDPGDKSHPLGHVDQAVERVAEYKGVEQYEGFRCHVVWLVNRARSNLPGAGTALGHTVLWLPEERNLIPVAMASYRYDLSRTVPIGEGKVLEWLEVEPGIWCPKRVEVTSLLPRQLQQSGERLPNWRAQYRLTAVSLHPNHDISFFRNVKFPKGTVVYKLDEDGKITKGRQVSAPRKEKAAGSGARSNSLWRAWWLPAVFIVLLAAWCGYRVRRHRAARAQG
jgi:hypothetical protein